ncbi:MAG TPA: hypothetical protein VFQ45_22285 [Longimicrobium sp.]|nr:hypothetical protein [Longimicrobium sp.]
MTRCLTPLLYLALAAGAAACGGDDSADGDAAATKEAAPAGQNAPAATPAAAGKVNSEIDLTVTGGPHAGNYRAAATSGGCSYGFAGEGTWGNQYSEDTQDPRKFSSLQLIVPDAKGAAGGTSQFKMTVQFGQLFGGDGASYDIDTRPDANTPQGEGTLTVEDRGSSGTVRFDGKTRDGVGLKGTINCHTVARAGG